MNERILKLVEQARQYAWENETHWSAGPERERLFEQKFAELIVKECAKACEENSYLALNGWQRAKQIREHFGVEE